VGAGQTRRFGNYEILEEVAHGGMGVVYKARQTNPDRIVAVKMVLAGRFASTNDIQRFRAEAEATGKLNHPNIVPIYETGEHDGLLFFSMPLIDGGTLAQALAQRRFKPQEAIELLVPIARAVHYAHQRGILHRDLKPGNILLDENGLPHVTDFGLAKWMDLDSSITATGMVLGSPSYMAPEQASGKPDISTATDVYGLGAILYELLSGTPPHRGATSLDTILQVRDCEPKPLRRANSSIPSELEAICVKALEKKPDQRYPSAEELASDLERWLRGEPVRAKHYGPIGRTWKWARRHPAVGALTGVSVVAAVAMVSAFTTETVRRSQQKLLHQTEKALHQAQQAQQAEKLARAEADLQQKRAEAEGWRAADNFYLASITWADVSRQANDYTHANQTLDDCPESRRNWEWHYLKRLCNSEQDIFRNGSSLAVAATADSLLALNKQGTLTTWNLATKQTSSTHRIAPAQVSEAAFTQDARSLVTHSFMDEFVRIWDVNSGTQIVSVTFPTARSVAAVAISPEGTHFAAASLTDHSVRVYGTKGDQPVATLSQEPDDPGLHRRQSRRQVGCMDNYAVDQSERYRPG
jgi:tRNA A-37 threonylcarbamoyl transferase component Bud32